MKKLMQKKRNATEGSLGGSKVDVVEEKKINEKKEGGSLIKWVLQKTLQRQPAVTNALERW